MSGINIIGLGGSMAASSASLSALRIALAGAGEAGAEVELFSIREMNLPMFVPTSRDVPDAAHRFTEAVHESQGLIWSSPLYHGMVNVSPLPIQFKVGIND